MDSNVKIRSRPRLLHNQLQKLARRLLRSNKPDADTPVIISTMGGEYYSSVGHILQRSGGRVSALVDISLESERAVTVFLPENAYLGEVTSCVALGKQFTVELVLIQYRNI